MQKKLYRSRTNKSLSGVCGGLGEYLNIDPTLVRVLWVVASLFMAGFPGLIVYIIMACVIPEAPEQPEAWQQPPYQQPYAPPPPQGWQQQPPQGNWQQPPQGTWQAPPPPTSPAEPYTDYTQPAPPDAPVDAPPSE